MTDSETKAADAVRQHGPQLMLLARQWVGNWTDAQDVVQEAFVRFWPNRDRVRETRPYLFQSVRHVAMNFRRGEDRRQKRDQQPPIDVPLFRGPDQDAELSELRDAVQLSLTELPIEQREVVVMKVWGQLTFKAIAEVMECPPATVQSRYRYGLEALRQRLSVEAHS